MCVLCVCSHLMLHVEMLAAKLTIYNHRYQYIIIVQHCKHEEGPAVAGKGALQQLAIVMLSIAQ